MKEILTSGLTPEEKRERILAKTEPSTVNINDEINDLFCKTAIELYWKKSGKRFNYRKVESITDMQEKRNARSLLTQRVQAKMKPAWWRLPSKARHKRYEAQRRLLRKTCRDRYEEITDSRSTALQVAVRAGNLKAVEGYVKAVLEFAPRELVIPLLEARGDKHYTEDDLRTSFPSTSAKKGLAQKNPVLKWPSQQTLPPLDSLPKKPLVPRLASQANAPVRKSASQPVMRTHSSQGKTPGRQTGSRSIAPNDSHAYAELKDDGATSSLKGQMLQSASQPLMPIKPRPSQSPVGRADSLPVVTKVETTQKKDGSPMPTRQTAIQVQCLR